MILAHLHGLGTQILSRKRCWRRCSTRRPARKPARPARFEPNAARACPHGWCASSHEGARTQAGRPRLGPCTVSWLLRVVARFPRAARACKCPSGQHFRKRAAQNYSSQAPASMATRRRSYLKEEEGEDLGLFLGLHVGGGRRRIKGLIKDLIFS